MKLPKVLVVLSNANDGTSWYRGIGPWSEISKAGLAEVWYQSKPTWQDVRAVDIVWMLRPATKEMRPAVEAAKDFDVPLVVDYDDDLLNVPTDNPSYAFFALPEVQQCYRNCLQEADLVVASTPFLADRLKPLNKAENITVIRNALDPTLERFRKVKIPRNQAVIWRGSSTHDRDVASVAEEIVGASVAFPGHQWIFMGADPSPWAVSERIKKVVRVPKLGLMPYFKALYALAPQIMIVPLADQSFNRGKSNIAAIEGAWAGSAVIAPDWDEWRLPGVINYTDQKSFGAGLRSLLADPKKCADSAETLITHVAEHLSLSSQNKLRMAAVEELMERQ